MKLFTGWVLAAGLVLAGTTAQAQSPYSRVSDFTGPYSEAPYYREDAYRGGPYYAPPPQVAPMPAPPRYGYGYDPAPAPALLPPHEVYNIIREAGFSPLGIPRQRGYVYTIAVIDRGGEDGRLVIDGRNGQIIRFTPAWRTSQFGGAYNAVHSRLGPMLPDVTELRDAPRPPAPAPRVASRTVPVPKPNPLMTANAANAPAKPAAQAAAEPTTQQAAVAQPKPADPAPAPATVGQAEAKPAPSILPTQEMPKAQGLN